MEYVACQGEVIKQYRTFQDQYHHIIVQSSTPIIVLLDNDGVYQTVNMISMSLGEQWYAILTLPAELVGRYLLKTQFINELSETVCLYDTILINPPQDVNRYIGHGE